MRVLFDYQAFDMQRIGGVSNGFVQFISNLPTDIEPIMGLKGTSNVHLKESDFFPRGYRMFYREDFRMLNDFLYHKLQWHLKSIFPTPETVNRNYCIELMKQGNYDILHPTYFSSYFLEYNKRPFILTIHDMTAEIYGFDEFQQKGQKEQASEAAHIVVMSENTKNDVIKYLGVPEQKITVTYPAYTPYYIDERASPLINGNYILFVGARYFYKKFDYFVAQASKFIKRHPDFQIVCTGSPFSHDDKSLLKKYGVENHVIYKYCTTDELNNIYHNAFAFVYPSEYEGFGLPILEAFHAGCPVILNRKSCFPEIAGNGALYFDSDDENDTLLMRLEELFEMSEKNKNILISKAKDRLNLYSWERSAAKLAEVYRKVYRESHI